MIRTHNGSKGLIMGISGCSVSPSSGNPDAVNAANCGLQDSCSWSTSEAMDGLMLGTSKPGCPAPPGPPSSSDSDAVLWDSCSLSASRAVDGLILTDGDETVPGTAIVSFGDEEVVD